MHELERRFSKLVKITQSIEPIRRSRSFKVTDFSTNRKLIINILLFILVILINTGLT